MASLAHDEIGHGPTVVFLHGFCEDRALWNYHVSALRVECHIINIDLPGFGENEALSQDCSIDDLADRVHELLLELKCSSMVIVGHSLGGYVGLSLLERYPELFIGLSMFHSTAFADTQEKRENRDKEIAFIEKHGVGLFAQSFVPPLFNPALRESLKSEIEELVKVASGTSKSTVLKVTKAMRDRQDRIETVTMSLVPIQYIVGKADPAVPLESSLAQCYLAKDSQAHFLEKTGHVGMIDRPEETLQALKKFIQYCVDLCD